MSDMVPFSRDLSKRDSREVRRELSRIDGRGRVELARLNQQADLQAERISAIGYVGKCAQHQAAMLTQAEVQLSAAVPSAAGRLQWLGNMTVLAMGGVVSETERRVK
jgi:hypothetical protein